MTPPRNLEAARHGQTTKLANNAVINTSGSLAFYLAVVIVTPLAIHGLGDRMWGVWQLVGSLTTYALLINLGLNGAVSYHVANAIARDDPDELGSSIHHARLYFIIAGTLIAAIFLIAGRPIVARLVGANDSGIAYLALVLSATITGLTLPVRVYTSVLSGMQRFDVIAIARLVSGLVLVVGCGFGFLLGQMGLLSFVVLMTVAPAVPGFASWIATRRILPGDVLRWRRLDLPFLREMLSYSVSTVLYTAGNVILYQSMKVMAAWKVGGPIAAGHIGLVVNLAQTLSVVFIPLVSVLHPRVRDLASRDRVDELPALLNRSLLATGLLAMPVVVFTTLESRLILDAWVGDVLSPETIGALSQTVRWMMIGQGPFIFFLPCFYALVGLGAHRVFGLGMIGAGLVNIAVGWLAVSHRPEIESLGLAFGITVAALVFLVTVPVALARFGIPYWVGLRDAMVFPFLVSTPGILVLFMRPEFANSRADLLLAAVIFSICVAPGLFAARYLMSK